MEDNQKTKKWYQKWWVWIIIVFLITRIPMETIKAILVIIGILIVIVLFLSKKSNEQSTVPLPSKEKEESHENDYNGTDDDKPDDCYNELEDTDTAVPQNKTSSQDMIKDIAKNTPSKKIKDKNVYVIEQPKKRHFGWVLWIMAIILLLFLMVYSRNKISPFVLIIGIVGTIFSGSLLWKMLTEKNSEIQKLNKGRAKYISLLLLVSMIMTFSGYFTLRIRDFDDLQREKNISNITIKGADENTAPLAVSDFKLLKKGDQYTVICNLKKTSSSPANGFFKFTIALIDKNGRQINSADIINTLDSYSQLFTYGSTHRFEKNISVSKGKNKPVTVEFLNIKECDENDYVKYLLDKARQEITYKFYNSAKQYIQQAFEYDPDNEDAKSLMEQIEKADAESSDTDFSYIETTPTEKDVLIGTSKANVRRLLSKYKETKSIMSNNALDFEDENLLITVYFNSDDIADGVLFMQGNLDNVDTLTGVGSYVSKHYDELVRLATDDPNIKIETDLTLYNSHGVKKQPMDLYIGNVIHETPSAQTSKDNNNKEKNMMKFNPKTGEWEEKTDNSSSETQSNNTETKKKNEFSQCLTSGIAMGVKLYSAPSNDSYVGTITNVSNDILDDRGKKTKAVYISGGIADGWYKRSDVGTLYVRNDDPHLPAGRYAAEAMGAN